MNPMKAGKRSAVCAVFLSAAALGVAAPAAADDTDDAFIANLSKRGITMPDNDNAIVTAHMLCSSLDTNPNAPVLAFVLARDTDLSPRQAGYFVGLSVATYCPQYKDKVGPSVS